MDDAAYISSLVDKARAAQAVFERDFGQEAVEAILRDMAKVTFRSAEPLARLAADETRMGNYESKVKKIQGKSRIFWWSLRGKKSMGIKRSSFLIGEAITDYNIMMDTVETPVRFDNIHHIHDTVMAWARSVPGVLALEGGRTPDALQSALERAGAHPGLSLIHLPVYYGPNPLGGMGVYGRWNVGNWCDDVQALRHEIGL